LLAAATMLLANLAGIVLAAYDTFSVKSVNLESADAVSFFEKHSSAAVGIADAHAVYGVEASDGGLVVIGKGLHSEANPSPRAFAAKLDATGYHIEWTWSMSVDSGANSVLELPGANGLLVSGYQKVQGTYRASLTRLSLATGVEVWTATFAGGSNALHSAWEAMDLTMDGASILLGGLRGKPDEVEFNFKSYGNAEGGEAIAVALPLASCTGSSPPTESDASWYGTFSGYHTAKAVRPLPGGDVAVLLWQGYEPSKGAALARLTASGAVVWGPTNYGEAHGEGTEMMPNADGSALLFVGHGYGQTCCCTIGCTSGCSSAKLYGRLSRVNAASGEYEWTRSFDAEWIKNECFGVQVLDDGSAVLSCGTGVEDCRGMTGKLPTRSTLHHVPCTLHLLTYTLHLLTYTSYVTLDTAMT